MVPFQTIHESVVDITVHALTSLTGLMTYWAHEHSFDEMMHRGLPRPYGTLLRLRLILLRTNSGLHLVNLPNLLFESNRKGIG